MKIQFTAILKKSAFLSAVAAFAIATVMGLSACDTRSPGEKISDGAEDASEGNVSEGMSDIGEGIGDAISGD